MTTYYMDLKFIVTGHATIEELEAELEDVLDHLDDLDGVIDPDLTARLSEGKVMFSLGMNADSGPEALRDALVAVRTAIHACDGNTPKWDALFDEVEQTIRRAHDAELVDA